MSKPVGGIIKPEKAELPRIKDRITFLYAEKCTITRDDGAISMRDENGCTNIPSAGVSVLLLGPGTTVSHKAIQAMAESGMCIIWVGEYGVRFYASGRALNGNTTLLLLQAEYVSDVRKRIEVARRMYGLRFPDQDLSGYKMKQMLGIEGTRVQKIYRELSVKYSIPWNGRNYDPDDFDSGNDINKAISIANTCMYGVCHAVICALGLSPGLGFIHTGNEMSFVHDISDIYKMDISVPTAFHIVASHPVDLEGDVRHAMRDKFKNLKFLDLVVNDINFVLNNKNPIDYLENRTSFWSGAENTIEGGKSYGDRTQ